MKKILLALLCISVVLMLASCMGTGTGAAGGENAQEVGPVEMLVSFIPMILVVVVFYFFMLRPQKKQDKEINDMRESLALGDIIITKGGIVGRIVRIKDDMMLIETGGNKTRLQIQKTAVSEIKAKANVPEEDK